MGGFLEAREKLVLPPTVNYSPSGLHEARIKILRIRSSLFMLLPWLETVVPKLFRILRTHLGGHDQLIQFFWEQISRVDLLVWKVPFRSTLAGFYAVHYVGHELIELWPRANDARIVGSRQIINQKRLFASVKDEIPASVVEVRMLQEELQHCGVSDCPNEIDSAVILVRSNHGKSGGNPNSSRHQDLTVVPNGILVRTRKRALDPNGTDRVSLKKLVHFVGPITSPFHEYLAFFRILGVFEQREGMPLVAVYPGEANVGISSMIH